MPAELTQTINYIGLQQYIGEVQALLAPHRQKKKDPQKFANKIAAVVQKAYHLTRIGNEQPFMPALAAEWISLFHNDGNLAKKFIFNPRSVFFPDKLKENFGYVTASKKTRASGGGALTKSEKEESGGGEKPGAGEGGSRESVAREGGGSRSGTISAARASGSVVPVLAAPVTAARSSTLSAPPSARLLASAPQSLSQSSLRSASSAASSVLLSGPQSARLSAPAAAPAALSSVSSSASSYKIESSSSKEGEIKLEGEKKSISDLESLLRNAQEDLNSCNIEIIELKEELKDSNTEINNQSFKLEALKTKNIKKNDNLREQIDTLKKKLRQQIIQKEENLKLFINLEEKKIQLEINVLTLEKKLQSCKTKKLILIEKLKKLKKENNFNKRKILKLRFKQFKNVKENNNIQLKLNEESEINDKLFRKITELKKTLEENQSNNKISLQNLTNQISRQTEEISKIKEELETCNRNLQLCETYKLELIKMLKKLQKENDYNKQEILKLSSKQFENFKENNNIQLKLNKESEINNKLHRKITDLELKLNEKYEINDTLHRKITDLEKTLEENQSNNKISLQNLTNQISRQTEEISKIKKELETCTNDLQLCNAEKNKLKKELLLCKKGVKNNNEKISDVHYKSRLTSVKQQLMSIAASATNPPPSSIAASATGPPPKSNTTSAASPPPSSTPASAASATGQQKKHVDSPMHPRTFSNKLFTSEKVRRKILPVQVFSNSPKLKIQRNIEVENEVKLNKNFYYPYNKISQGQKCIPFKNNNLTDKQLKEIYDFYKKDMQKRNKNLKPNYKMNSVGKKNPSFEEMCEDLKKLTNRLDENEKLEFIEKVQMVQSSATTTS